MPGATSFVSGTACVEIAFGSRCARTHRRFCGRAGCTDHRHGRAARLPQQDGACGRAAERSRCLRILSDAQSCVRTDRCVSGRLAAARCRDCWTAAGCPRSKTSECIRACQTRDRACRRLDGRERYGVDDRRALAGDCNGRERAGKTFAGHEGNKQLVFAAECERNPRPQTAAAVGRERDGRTHRTARWLARSLSRLCSVVLSNQQRDGRATLREARAASAAAQRSRSLLRCGNIRDLVCAGRRDRHRNRREPRGDS